MPFSHIHSDFERQSLQNAKELIVASHGQEEYKLDPRALEIRKRKHTGIELSGPELVYLQHDMSEKISTLQNKIETLRRSIAEGSAPNASRAKGELQKYEQELDFPQHNFTEKLFQKPEEADNKVAI